MRAMLGRAGVEDRRQVARQHGVNARHNAGQDMSVILEGGREWGERTSQRAPSGVASRLCVVPAPIDCGQQLRRWERGDPVSG
jgi:hypothetical protein